MHTLCMTYKPSGPRVNWPTVNTHNIIYVISYMCAAIWCYRRAAAALTGAGAFNYRLFRRRLRTAKPRARTTQHSAGDVS